MIIQGIVLALALASAGNLTPGQSRAAHARANYEALASGRRQLNQLTPQELADLLELAKALRSEPDTRSPSERCYAEQLERAGGSPSELEQRIIDLKCRRLGTGLQ